MEMEKDFFDRIDNLLKQQKKTQKEFAEYVGFSAPQAFVTQRNRRTLPRVDMAIKMARFLNTSVEYLATGAEKDTYRERYERLRHAVQESLDNN